MSCLEEAKQVAAQADLLFDQTAIDVAVTQLAEAINARTQGRELLVLCLMNGGLVTTALLIPKLNNLMRMDYIHATRYRDATEGDQLKWLAGPHTSLADKTVLVIDDIFDEGHTLAAVCAYCGEQGAKQVYSAVLVNKVHQRKTEGFVPHFIGLDVPDRYVFGCGMDYKGYLRNLPGIYALVE